MSNKNSFVGRTNWRQTGLVASMTAVLVTAAMASAQSGQAPGSAMPQIPGPGSQQMPPPVPGIPPVMAIGRHHKIPVSDIEVSATFYQKVFGAIRLTAADHYIDRDHRIVPLGRTTRDDKTLTLYASILHMNGLDGDIELRLNPQRAACQRGWDEISVVVKDKAALAEWIVHLDKLGIKHSEILPSLIGYLVVFDDPDGRRIRLNELGDRHGPEVPATPQSNVWISED